MYRIMPKSECTLTTTIVGEWIIDEKDKKDVDDEMRLFQCAVRTAFNRLLACLCKHCRQEGMIKIPLPPLYPLSSKGVGGLEKGENKGDVEKLVSSMFNINSRYAKDAVMQAMSIQSSQRELIKQHKEEKERAIRGFRG